MNNKKKVLYVSTSRADFWIIKDLLQKLINDGVDLSILISGMHLSKKFGSTYKDVIKYFPNNNKIIRVNPNKNNSKFDILKIMTTLQKKFTNYLKKNKVDYLMLLGDRSEILPFAICASLLKIPIIHLHGGEITYGAYDEFIRHCITKMSSLHLTSTEKHKKRVMQMGESNVYNIGSLGSMNAHKYKYKKMSLSYDDYFLFIYHPTTNIGRDEFDLIKVLLNKLSIKTNLVIIGCNNDLHGNKFNEMYREICNKNSFHFFDSLSSDEYFSIAKDSKLIITNSSSGIIELPCLCKPIICLGDRQKGRERSVNIINLDLNVENVLETIDNIDFSKKIEHINPYCNLDSINMASEKIEEFLNEEKKEYKEFIDVIFK